MKANTTHLERLVDVFYFDSSGSFTCDTCANQDAVIYNDPRLGLVSYVCLWCLLHLVERNDGGLRWLA